jgi:hypothetical protein
MVNNNLEKKLGLYYELKKNPGDKLKKTGLQDLKFVYGLNKTQIKMQCFGQSSLQRKKIQTDTSQILEQD